MHNLGTHFRQSSIGVADDFDASDDHVNNNNGDGTHPLRMKKPMVMVEMDRKSTIDQFEIEMEGKSKPLDELKNGRGIGAARPSPINNSNRASSLESIKLDEG